MSSLDHLKIWAWPSPSLLSSLMIEPLSHLRCPFLSNFSSSSGSTIFKRSGVRNELCDFLIKGLRSLHHHHMAGIGKNLQFRTLDSMVKKFGILYGRELVIISTKDKRGKMNFFNFFHNIKSITRCEVAVKDFWPTLQHIGNASFDKHQRRFSRVGGRG